MFYLLPSRFAVRYQYWEFDNSHCRCTDGKQTQGTEILSLSALCWLRRVDGSSLTALVKVLQWLTRPLKSAYPAPRSSLSFLCPQGHGLNAVILVQANELLWNPKPFSIKLERHSLTITLHHRFYLYLMVSVYPMATGKINPDGGYLILIDWALRRWDNGKVEIPLSSL